MDKKIVLRAILVMFEGSLVSNVPGLHETSFVKSFREVGNSYFLI